jgi:NAD(P)-dependent dehydrogenase (short-subunit alcohol dehydrogenase family)
MNRLDGKVAIVTGGASGIGLATVRLFLESGARVVVGDIQAPPPAVTGAGVAFLETDVRDPAQVEALVRMTVERHDGLHVVFNNAGIEFHGPLAATDPADHRRMVDINLNGAYYVVQAAVRAMLTNPGPARGSIVNTASVAGLTGCPGLSTYNATKAGVVMLTKNASLEYGPFGIRVNAVCPGIIRTPMALASVGNDAAYLEGVGRKAHPLGRLGEAEEVAKLVCFLASDDASFISGAAIPIDGAMTAGFSAAPGWDPDEAANG